MGGSQYFSVPIFLICLREVLEASIILSVLLALVEQIVRHSPTGKTLTNGWADGTPNGVQPSSGDTTTAADPSGEVGTGTLSQEEREKRLIKRLRIQIFAGTFVGLLVAFAIGAAFLAVYYTTLNDLYGNSEELWEGIFSLIACVMIFIMGLTMMRMDRAKAKWRVKLARAFEAEVETSSSDAAPKGRFHWLKTLFSTGKTADTSGKSSKYILFLLPAITVLREGLEAVVFVGGVSLGQPASSIPIAAIVGIVVGILIGYVLYASSHRVSLSIFLVVSTAFLFLIGAGLLAKAVWYFTLNKFVKLVGGDVAEAGAGPGSFPVDNYIWHVNYGNPEYKLSSGGWSIFAGIFGWNNTGYVQTVLVYILYWVAVSACLVYMKWSEGRCTLFGVASKARKERLAKRERKVLERENAGLGKVSEEERMAVGEGEDQKKTDRDGSEISELSK